MISKTKRLQDLFHAYEAHIGKPGSLPDAIKWGVATGIYVLPEVDPVTVAVGELRDALRAETHVDAQGREYRANAAVTFTKGGGVQHSLWGSVDSATTPHEFKVEHFGQRRRQIEDDCFKFKVDLDHHNDGCKPGEEIQTSFDFREDMEEREAKRQAELDAKKDAAE